MKNTMQKENNTPEEGPQDIDKAQQQCLQTVKALVEPGKPESNWFAVCIICNPDGETRIAVNANDALTPLDVAREVQAALDQFWAHAKSN